MALRVNEKMENGMAVKGYADRSPLLAPRACTPEHRLKLGWFSRCDGPGRHLHESCTVCGLRWLTAFAEGA